MQLVITAVKPFTELSLKVPGIQKDIIVGIKSYLYDESIKVRDELSNILSSNALEKVTAELNKHISEGDKTLDSFYEIRDSLLSEQRALQEDQDKALFTFYKEQILFLKNVEVTVEDKTLLIKDTRSVEPIESLWGTSEEALAVLLDTFLNYTPFRDSLIQKLTPAIFNPAQDSTLKN